MTMRTSFLSMLLLVGLFSATQAVEFTTVTFQNGVDGYNSQQMVGFDGNGTPLPGHGPYFPRAGAWGGTGYMDGMFIDGETWRNHVQLVRFDDIFGSGPNQIPSGVTIDSATLTLVQVGSLTDFFHAHRALLDWSEGDAGVNYGPATATRPRGPDLGTIGGVQEVTTTYTASAAAVPRVGLNGGEIVFDMTSELQFFQANPAQYFGWAMVLGRNAGGINVYASTSLSPAGTVPLLEVTFSIPEPSTSLLLGVGVLGMIRYRRRRRA